MEKSFEKVEKSQKSKLSLEKSNPLITLVIFLVIGLITLITIFISLQLKNPVAKDEKIEEKTCKTPECIHLAHQLNNWRDPDIDPCIDFYKASCGRYTEHTVVDGDRNEKKTIIVHRLLDEFLRDNGTSESTSELNMKKVYQRCDTWKNEQTLQLEFDNAFPDILRNIDSIGNFPILDPNWNESEFDVNEILENMSKLGILDYGLFKLDYRFPVFALTWDDSIRKFLKDPEFKKFCQMILLGVKNLIINDQKLEYHVNRAKSVLQQMENLPGTPSITVVSEIQKNNPNIDFLRIVENIIDSEDADFTKRIVEKIVVFDKGMLMSKEQNLETFLRDTPKRDIADFLFFKYMTQVYTIFKDTSKPCVMYVVDRFPLASLRYFSLNFFDRQNVNRVVEMVNELKSSFVEMFQKSTWLSEKTKQKAILKLEAMRFSLGVPEQEGWEMWVDEQHEKLNISSSDVDSDPDSPTDTLIQLHRKIAKFRLQNYLKFLAAESMFNPEDDHLETNAYHHRLHNKLIIMLPFLYPPHFDDSYPKFAQIATVGYVLGHEIGHGFDFQGVQFDEKGLNGLWLNGDEEVEEYVRRGTCVFEQYENYDDPDYGRRLNGTTTILETVSDLIGIDATWRTYKKIDNAEEPRIIGFEEHDTDKVFFHTYALSWCRGPNKTPLEKLRQTHPSNSFRVNGVMQNFQPFADAFKCPLGSPMNPENKCKIY